VINHSSLGRIDYAPDESGRADEYHVGRLAVSDEELNPLVIDWRAPVAEAFYRATGVEPLGLARRRHVAIHGHDVTGRRGRIFRDANGDLALPRTTCARRPKRVSSTVVSRSAGRGAARRVGSSAHRADG